MSLFMPTNIIPSAIGELGDGTVDLTQPLVISWQVNGNSAMVAFQIDFYKNDTASTLLYSTGKQPVEVPFYGTNYAGDVQFFSHTIDATLLAEAGMKNGNEYKFIITQWWSEDDSVVQNSASVFFAKTTPTLSIATIPSPLAARLYSFTANYTQEQGDTINWVRWQIAYVNNTDAPFYDTQRIYGTNQLQVDYDGFFTDNDYAVKCTVQTSSGVEVDTGWVEFSVAYETSTLQGFVSAKKVCQQNVSAIEVSWQNVTYIDGAGTGNYVLSENKASLADGASLLWNEINRAPFFIDEYWSLAMRTKLEYVDLTILTIGQQDGENISLSYSSENMALTLTKGEKTILTVRDVRRNGEITFILTPYEFRVLNTIYTGGLYPSKTLYPSKMLFPASDNERQKTVSRHTIWYYQSPITSVEVFGKQKIDFIQVFSSDISQDSLNHIVSTHEEYNAEYSPETLFLADFKNGLNAGTLPSDEPLSGFAVYRRHGEVGSLLHLADIPLSQTTLYDYGAVCNQGDYTYYIFPIGTEIYASTPLISNAVNPCWWNWTVLECEPIDGHYSVVAEYDFGKNLSTDAMSNNNTPSILQNFTQYPTVQRSPQNYKSGSLQSLIGIIKIGEDMQMRYEDTIAQRDAIFNLSTTKNALFLKNRKGDLIEISVSSPITMQTMDESASQAQTVSLPWVEIAPADAASIVAFTIPKDVNAIPTLYPSNELYPSDDLVPRR